MSASGRRGWVLGVCVALAGACGDPGASLSGALRGGGTVGDEEAQGIALEACREALRNHGDCVSCAAHVLGELRRLGRITGAQSGRITSWFAHNGCVEPERCTPSSCEWSLGRCGVLDDGCGGWIECGCGPDFACVEGMCQYQGEHY